TPRRATRRAGNDSSGGWIKRGPEPATEGQCDRGRRSRMLARALTGFGSRDLLLLAAVFAIVLCVWGVVELADDVIERTPLALDEWVMSALRNPDHPAVVRGPPWLHEWTRDVTALGSMPVLLVVIGIVAGFLAMTRRYSALVLLLAAVA